MINQFTALAGDPRLTFLGNVRVGRDLSLAELRRHYSAVVLCYGAESDRRLGVPGEVGGAGERLTATAASAAACSQPAPVHRPSSPSLPPLHTLPALP